MKRRELQRRLRALGWALIRSGGRHEVWGRDIARLVVPRHTEINEYTARAILKEAKGG
jgi:mRNA interferase HicA